MTGAKLAAGAAVAVILHVLLRRTKSPFALPGVLLASFAAMHLVLLFERHLDRRGTSERLDVQSATGGRILAAVENGRPACISLGAHCRPLPATCSP